MIDYLIMPFIFEYPFTLGILIFMLVLLFVTHVKSIYAFILPFVTPYIKSNIESKPKDQIKCMELSDFRYYIKKTVEKANPIYDTIIHVSKKDGDKIEYIKKRDISIITYLTVGLTRVLPGPCVYIKSMDDKNDNLAKKLVAEYRVKYHINVGIL